MALLDVLETEQQPFEFVLPKSQNGVTMSPEVFAAEPNVMSFI